MSINKSQANGYGTIREKVKGKRDLKMSLSVSTFNQKTLSGIDTASVKETTQAILKRAESKTVDLSTLDLTKFKRADVGMDFYSGRVDAATARQVAMTNVGLQVNLSDAALKSLNYLNSQAAVRNVDGKITTAAVMEQAADSKKINTLPKFSQLIQAYDLGQDKRGSNPFYKGELLNVKKTEGAEEENINIFA